MIEYNLSEEDVISLCNNNWNSISRFEYLTEEFIIKHINELDLFLVCIYQNLSEIILSI